MALTPTTEIPLGFNAPDFNLEDAITGKMMSLADCKGAKGTAVIFICNHCPYVVLIKDKLAEIALDFWQKGIKVVAINSNDVERYPDDRPELMKEDALEHSYTFPYLFDETQEVAKAYNAACTPDINVFDADLQCVYRGQFCDARPGNDIEPTGKDLIAVFDALVNRTQIPRDQKISTGCSIKWKPN